MIGSYGIAKIDIAAITDANVQFLRETDLGLLYRSGISESVSPVPNGKILTATITTPGVGYSVPLNGTVLCNTTADASGAGAQILVRTDASSGGLLVPGSSVTNTASFDNYQNALLLAYDPNYEYVTGDTTDPFTYARVTTDDKPFTGVSAAVIGTSLTGSAGTFIVTISNGSVTAVEVGAAGAGYKVGDVVTITKAALEAGGGNTFQGDLQILLNDYNITGQVTEIVSIIGGGGYIVGEVLTLQEVGSSQIGTATVTVATLETLGLSTPGPINKYPTGIMNTGATAGAIAVKDTVGNTVVLGAMQPGVIRPFGFSQVMDAAAGTTPAVGEITILYR